MNTTKNEIAVPVYTAQNLPVLEWDGQRVVTTETLAKGYGSDVANIRKNLTRNEKRFSDGVHFFKLTGSDLREFKNRVSLSHSVQNNRVSKTDAVGKNARSLTLWTERGAARMSKIVDTDQAWEFFEKLENAYFRPRQPEQQPTTEMAMLLIQALAQQNQLTQLVLERSNQQSQLTQELLNEIRENRQLRAEQEPHQPLTNRELRRERDELAERLGQSRNYATLDAVERKMGREYQWHRLRNWCIRNNVEPLVLRKFQCVHAWPRGAWLDVYGVDLEELFG
ncbi:ORF6N domain-containing protein [uncultured Citrobacter sp.]|uniref:ORF6N domain-containing protein n=1 Tax=uncultured Citrobacter sp. TaxID=200446 RepID=UPI00259464F1|nr:ORF6N domain-containing protein [uncultured Citrobacter sp.]